MEEIHCLEVHFRGRVQGVGFRWSTWKLAENYPLVGYVKNLANGSVEMIVEGEESKVKAFLSDLRDQMSTCIESCEIVESQGFARFEEFAIIY